MWSRLGKALSGSSKPTADSTPEQTSAEFAAADSLDLWSTVQVDGHRVDVFDPSNDAASEGCVIFLHGHGRVMLNENPTFSQLFKKHNLCAVCPDGQRSWWMDRICTEFSPDISPQDWLLEQLLPFIEERFHIEPPKIGLLGISMGGQGALQLSFRHAGQFPVVAAISPAIDFHQLYGHGLPLDELFTDIEDARQSTVVLNLHPLAWPRHQWYCCDPEDTDWMDGCVRLGMKLSSSGILHERDLETSGGGHSWEYFNRMAEPAVSHIAKGLASY